ncbi:ligand-binding protein SH3 [Phyllobacterium phragmitis]|uniref:Ligand-binding protein SH3 n=2 Tax=Phyllobacterium phragmitis TaxID=2670329 RepID=A0A2S9IVC9_9HYPH|nr:SH3 domain-containing protein [Phyllobacterium phragmitis]PRD44474.1 ligand-binding protein SH3 [Phyllobacterium phragmitis]
MNLRGGIFSAVLLSTVLFSVSPALAEDAFTTAALNVRTGPGVGYARVATLPPGAEVDMGVCRGGWCRVSTGRVSGWASARYLNSAPGYSSGNRVVIVGPGPFWGPPPFWRHRRHHWGPGPVRRRPYWGAPSWTAPGPVLPPPYWRGPRRGGPHFRGPGPVRPPHIRPWGPGR